MNELISLEHFLERSYSKEILQLNEVSSWHGFTLSEREAAELSDTRRRAIAENDRIEPGLGALPYIVKKFSSSRYVTQEDYAYILNEVTALFYYIKTETNEALTDEELIKELFRRFELRCRGSIDLLGTEAERLIRKLVAGKDYKRWYWYRDDLYACGGNDTGDTPEEVLVGTYGVDFFDVDELADHDFYAPEIREGIDEELEAGFDLDTFDDFRRV